MLRLRCRHASSHIRHDSPSTQLFSISIDQIAAAVAVSTIYAAMQSIDAVLDAEPKTKKTTINDARMHVRKNEMIAICLPFIAAGNKQKFSFFFFAVVLWFLDLVGA